GCASFVATGADEPGEGVTALGTTMTIKLLSDRPISAPEYGIYSHRILGQWLAGGASNTGGRVLLKFFDAEAISRLSTQLDPEADSPFDYYPLAEPGERFPIADPALAPRLEPRPEGDADFLHGLFDGIARIEALAYARLRELGAPKLASVRTVGGGAQNATWTRLRERRLGVPMIAPASAEAAYGSALLARRGVS
ncbi:MAG: FGGY-family carbohydrate kinase, partial [Acidimicrobiia bacterium]|nr:FGGY-family carbohydrate kinase [Acidimicrobiia bacterium]